MTVWDGPGALILWLHPLEQVLDNDARLKEQINGVVQRGPAHMKGRAVKRLLQLVNGEMAVERERMTQNCKTLRRLAQLLSLKKRCELLENGSVSDRVYRRSQHIHRKGTTKTANTQIFASHFLTALLLRAKTGRGMWQISVEM